MLSFLIQFYTFDLVKMQYISCATSYVKFQKFNIQEITKEKFLNGNF